MAEKFSRLALDIRETRLGLIHPGVAKNLNNLGTIYDAQELFSKSEPLYLRALKIWEHQLGPNHVDLTLGLSNLAMAYIHQGKPNLAEPLLLRSLVIWKKAVGPNHPETALSMQLLANCYVEQKRYPEAKQLYESALDIWEKAGRQNQRDFAVAVKKLGDMNFIQGLYPEAESNYSKALTANENTFGKGHFGSISILNGLGYTRLNQGSPKDALSFMRRSASICRARPAPEVRCNKVGMGAVSVVACWKSRSRGCRADRQRSASICATHQCHWHGRRRGQDVRPLRQRRRRTGQARPRPPGRRSARRALGPKPPWLGPSKSTPERKPVRRNCATRSPLPGKQIDASERRTHPPFPRVPGTRPPAARVG